MADHLQDTMLFRRLEAQPSVPDPLTDKIEAQALFDETLSQLGVRAPSPEPKESDAQYLARLGEFCAAFGPDERKSVNRYNLPAAALSAFVKEDLEIARKEAETPNYTLKEGVLTERRRADRSGREVTEFYSKSGPNVWMDSFKEPVVRYVSGGSNGILDPDKPRPPTHSFMKSQTAPELIAMKRIEAYHNSAEYKVIEAYKSAGKVPPAEVLKKVANR